MPNSTSYHFFLASPDAQEVMWVSQSVTHWLTPGQATWLMWPWWVMIPLEDFTDEDEVGDDDEDEYEDEYEDEDEDKIEDEDED